MCIRKTAQTVLLAGSHHISKLKTQKGLLFEEKDGKKTGSHTPEIYQLPARKVDRPP